MVSHLLWAQLTPTHKLFIAREYTLDGSLGVRHKPSDSTTSWFTVLGNTFTFWTSTCIAVLSIPI